jgi:hypothetical protein
MNHIEKDITHIYDPPESPNWPSLSSKNPQNTIQELISIKIVHFFYNLTRKEDSTELNELSVLFSDILRSIKHSFQCGELPHKDYLHFLSVLFKMVIQTRDFEMGKGERDITYMMIFVWYQYYPVLSVLLIRLMVGMNLPELGREYLCFGSWKDIISLCQYIHHKNTGISISKQFHPLIETCIEIAIQQLHFDSIALKKNEKISFVAKWIPREKSSAGHLFYDRFVQHWIQKTKPWILQTPDNKTKLDYAWNKSRRIFRKVLSLLNRTLDTTEIKMCSQNWASISPEKINFLTFIRSRDAFLNLSKKKANLSLDVLKDRELCSQRVKEHFYSNKLFQKVKYNDAIKNNPFDSGIRTFSCYNYPIKTLPFRSTTDTVQNTNTVSTTSEINEKNKNHNTKLSKTSKLRNYPLSVYVKRAFELISLSASSPQSSYLWIQKQIDILNQQWRYNLSFHLDLVFTIPIVDIPILEENLSFSTGSLETLYQVIGVACFISEKSTLDKRMLFLIQNKPVWLNLSNCLNFYSMIQEIHTLLPSFYLKHDISYTRSSSEGVIQSIQMILESISNINMSQETSEKMLLIFLQNWGERTTQMIQQIDQQCSQFHITHFKDSSWKTPHIVYWNFHSKTISSLFSMNKLLLKERTTFFSGFSSSFIDYLCFMGVFNIRDSTPYQTICHLFDHPHYDIYEKIFQKIVS